MWRVLIGVLLVGISTTSAFAMPPTTTPRDAKMGRVTIVKEAFGGWTNTYVLNNDLAEVRVVADIGPRIVDFHLTGGRNVLYLRESEVGKQAEPEWVFRGGWRLWVAPEIRETTYALDNSPCEVEIVDDVLRVTGPPQTGVGIRKQVDVSLVPGQPHLHIVGRIKNVSDHPLNYAGWSLPVLRPGGRAFVPLDVGSITAFDAIRKVILWSYAELKDPRYVVTDRLIEIDQRRVHAPPAGQSGRRDDESKIGVDSTQGWAAYGLDGSLFLKRFAHDPKGQYPDGGATIEVYSSYEFLELENLGPMTVFGPGEEIILPEDWWLFSGVSVPSPESGALSVLQEYVSRTTMP